jgi:5'-3' exonuclease
LLPNPLNTLISSESSPIKRLIPDKVEVDCSGKRQEWEGIVLVPIISDDDMNMIKKHYTIYKQHMDTIHDRFNCVKKSLKFTYDGRIKNFTYKSYYGEIPNCHVKMELFDI